MKGDSSGVAVVACWGGLYVLTQDCGFFRCFRQIQISSLLWAVINTLYHKYILPHNNNTVLDTQHGPSIHVWCKYCLFHLLEDILLFYMNHIVIIWTVRWLLNLSLFFILNNTGWFVQDISADTCIGAWHTNISSLIIEHIHSVWLQM